MVSVISKCWLHIGTEKTGTTTLQSYLSENRAALAKSGFFVPHSLSPYAAVANHERLTTYSLADSKFGDDLRVAAGVITPAALAKHRQDVADKFAQECAAAPPHSTMLLSNEHCQSRLVGVEEVERLKTFLSQYVDDVRVIVYLRPQHEVAVSLYDQALKAGYCDIRMLPGFAGDRRWVDRKFFNYQDLLQRWSQVFGRGNVVARIFDRRTLIGHSIVSDYAELVGIDSAPLNPVSDRNTGIGSTYQRALNAINRYAQARRGSIGPALRQKLIDVLTKQSTDGASTPLRADAMAFYEQFRDGNEAVRQAYFPDRTALFDLDFSKHPETLAEPMPEGDALIKLVLEILRFVP